MNSIINSSLFTSIVFNTNVTATNYYNFYNTTTAENNDDNDYYYHDDWNGTAIKPEISNHNHHHLVISGEHDDDDVHATSGNCTTAHRCDGAGMLLPGWQPPIDGNSAVSVKIYRAVVYLLVLAYVLFGVNIITDRMVSCIEVVIAQKRTVKVTLKSGETHTVQIPIWHPVVGALTVHVIGASAAEIFLPIIETAKHHFTAHELGSSLIFGSGAYHLFILTGLCLLSVKETTGKPIRDLRVFFVTTGFAIFAYLWMFILVDLVTPGEITLPEAIITICFFPLLVFCAWFADRRYYLEIRKKLKFCRGAVAPGEMADDGTSPDGTSEVMREIERKRRIAAFIKDLQMKYPNKSSIEIEGMAQIQLLESLPKDAAYYRMQAAKAMSGGGDVISKDKIQKRLEHEQKMRDQHLQGNVSNPNAQLVGFEQANLTVMESCGAAVVNVIRSGPGVDTTTLLVDFESAPDTAIPGDDYEEVKGTLEFQPGITTAIVAVNVIDDDEFEENKSFFVRLTNARFQQRTTAPINTRASMQMADSAVITQNEISVLILDDDHCGVFHFEGAIASFADNVGIAKVKVVRSTGARGRVKLPFHFIDNSAKAGSDFTVPEQLELTFENDQPEGFIEAGIVDQNRGNEVYSFFIEIESPILLTKPPENPLGNPVLGEERKIQVQICEDEKLAEIVDRLLVHGDIADLISSTTWADQFREAVQFGGASSTHDGEGESHNSKKCVVHFQKYFPFGMLKHYLLYGLSLPWRVLSATIPPPGYLHGWVAFLCLLVLMAFLSALIGDLATAFGCAVGIKDTVVAITLIAFGMGLPDTFASRHAAMHEHTSDAAIGGITGTNAVNVFLGIGMSWLAGAAYHAKTGTRFTIPSKNMGFIVVVYCVLATGAVTALMIRRLPPIGGELGGPLSIKYASAALFLLFWLTFVTLLTLESYCIIASF